MAWPKEELQTIAKADALHIAPFRNDGKTYGTPTWIWSVAVGDALYVRAYNGIKSRWYQAALKQKAGRSIAAGMTKEVSFEPVNGAINDRIDEACRAKYRESPYLNPMIGASAATARSCRATSAYTQILRTQRESNETLHQLPYALLPWRGRSMAQPSGQLLPRGTMRQRARNSKATPGSAAAPRCTELRGG